VARPIPHEENTLKKLSKRTLILIAGAAVAAIAAGGVAYAAFGYTPTAEANGAAENFDPVTVTVPATTATLLPGEKANIVLKLSNPNSPTKAKVASITPAGIEITGINDGANIDYCKSVVLQHVTDPANLALPTLGYGDANYTLNNGIEFDNAMDIRCEGIQYKSKWTVEFQAVRA
jgi:hypothetical protein